MDDPPAGPPAGELPPESASRQPAVPGAVLAPPFLAGPVAAVTRAAWPVVYGFLLSIPSAQAWFGTAGTK